MTKFVYYNHIHMQDVAEKVEELTKKDILRWREATERSKYTGDTIVIKYIAIYNKYILKYKYTKETYRSLFKKPEIFESYDLYLEENVYSDLNTSVGWIPVPLDFHNEVIDNILRRHHRIMDEICNASSECSINSIPNGLYKK